jgi:hypothetical protein
MPISFADRGPDGHFVPQPTLPRWSLAMAEAVRAHRLGRPGLAQLLYEDALQALLEAIRGDGLSDAEACVCALVSNSACLAALQIELGQPPQAAQTLARAHAVLIRLMLERPRASGWHQAAAWHSRETHAGLVHHWQRYGPDPAIESALRKACVLIRQPVPAVH